MRGIAFLLWTLGVLGVLAGTACAPVDAGASGAAVRLDRANFALATDGASWQVPVRIVNEGRETVSAQVRVAVTALDGTPDLVATATVLARPGITRATLDLGGRVPPELVPERVLRYEVGHRGMVDRGGFTLVEVLPQIETRLVVHRELMAGTQAALRVVARDFASTLPAGGATVRATLLQNGQERALFTHQTNDAGTIEERFEVPGDLLGAAELRVALSHPELGEDVVTHPVTVSRKHQILLTTDKPLYQPGQVIHMRALALGTGDRLPAAEQAITFEVMDSRGNKVFKQSTATEQHGVGFADFTLATELNQGSYTVRALLGEEITEKTVTVERYVLPKFEIALSTNRDFYQPGDTLTGEIQADYFFGKPVAGGRVRVIASKFEIGFEQFAELEGRLDDSGRWEFELTLPGFFAGTPIEQGQASVRLQAVVIDTAEHREEKTVMKPVAGEALTIQAVPEGGKLQPGLENRIYILVAQPDGSPAEGATVDVRLANTPGQSLSTNALGIAEYTVAWPENQDALPILITARDRQGRTANTAQTLESARRGEGLLLRTEQVLYRVGDALHAEVFATKPQGMVYFDVVRAGQTMHTRMARLDNGRASLMLDLDPSLAGSIVLNAYVFSSQTDIIRDARKLYVDPANDLHIDVALDAETYRPGQTAAFAFDVRDKEGNPRAAALGISIVDESVFALQEMHPGLEKVYFLLEEEIMKPRYEIHGHEMDELILRPAWDERQQDAARFLLAATPETRAPAHVNTAEAKSRQAAQALQREVNEDFNQIWQAIQKLHADRGRLPARDVLLSTLLRRGDLQERHLEDPWGNRYLFDFSSLDARGGLFSMRSPGPDGIPDTEDDLSTAYQQSPRGGFGGGGFRVLGRGVAVPELQALGYVGDVAPAAPPPAPMAEPAFAADSAASATAQPVRVREYFPETLLFEPALITDGDGKATLTVDMADSITTWRMTAMASAANGALGSLDTPVRVFQDFFVDIDLPVSLTQGDQVSIPVAIYNYLEETQDIRLQFEEGDWFTLEGEAEQTFSVQPDEVTVRYFPITVRELGTHRLTVHAHGSRLSDAIRREIEVRPNGERVEESVSDRISGNVTQQVHIPANAIPGASKILVKLFPGVFTQVVDGLDSMLRMPHGCFEQTSSVSYPNILIVRYMEETQQINPELRMTAEGYINAGYQRLLSFEVDGGGFSWFGDAPANQVLTAFGLKQFHDMARVHEVDPAIAERTRQWLFSKQQGDGSWRPDENYLHQESWGNIQQSNLLVTAYIAEALLTSGPADNRLNNAADYIRAHWQHAEDPYTLGIVANALVAWNASDALTRQVLERLHNLRIEQGDTAHWTSAQETVTFSRGNTAAVEATAMAALAFINAGMYPQTTTKALTWLIQQKQSSGHWGSTQATVLSLKALLLALGNQTEQVTASIGVRINGEVVTTLDVTPENSDVMRLVDLGEQTQTGVNTIGLDFAGEGSMLYQIVGRHYRPWAGARPGEEPMSIQVRYDKTQLAVDDLATATVTVTNNRPETANMVIVDLGIPPGFQVIGADLERLVEDGTIEKFELAGRQAILYFENIAGNATVEFSYQLRAKFPLRANTPETRVYEYYNPELGALAEPVAMVVE